MEPIYCSKSYEFSKRLWLILCAVVPMLLSDCDNADGCVFDGNDTVS
jgi:hypothetical protein